MDKYLDALEKFDSSEKSIVSLTTVIKEMFVTFDFRRLEEYASLLFVLPNLRRDRFPDTQHKMRFDYGGHGHIDALIQRNDGTAFAFNLYTQMNLFWALHRAVNALDSIQNQRGQKGRRDRVKYDVKHKVAFAMKYSKTDRYYRPGDNITLAASVLCADEFDLEHLFKNAVNVTV